MKKDNKKLFIKFMAFVMMALMIAGVVFMTIGFIQAGQTPPEA